MPKNDDGGRNRGEGPFSCVVRGASVYEGPAGGIPAAGAAGDGNCTCIAGGEMACSA